MILLLLVLFINRSIPAGVQGACYISSGSGTMGDCETAMVTQVSFESCKLYCSNMISCLAITYNFANSGCRMESCSLAKPSWNVGSEHFLKSTCPGTIELPLTTESTTTETPPTTTESTTETPPTTTETPSTTTEMLPTTTETLSTTTKTPSTTTETPPTTTERPSTTTETPSTTTETPPTTTETPPTTIETPSTTTGTPSTATETTTNNIEVVTYTTTETITTILQSITNSVTMSTTQSMETQTTQNESTTSRDNISGSTHLTTAITTKGTTDGVSTDEFTTNTYRTNEQTTRATVTIFEDMFTSDQTSLSNDVVSSTFATNMGTTMSNSSQCREGEFCSCRIVLMTGWMEDVILKDKRPIDPSNSIFTTDNINIIECGTVCNMDTNCLSFLYDPANNSCEGFSTLYDVMDMVSSTLTTQYFKRI